MPGSLHPRFILSTGSVCLLLFCLGCASVITPSPSVPLVVQPNRLSGQVAVYISPIYQRQVHSQTLKGPGLVEVQLGPALMKCTREALQPFFDQVLLLGPSETSSLPYRIDLRNDSFVLGEDFGADITIWCKVTASSRVVLEESFSGHAPGISDPGFKRLESARKEISHSSEVAFQDAFTKLEKAIREKVLVKK